MFFKYLVEMVYIKPFLPLMNLTKILLQIDSVQNFVEMDVSVWSLTWSTLTHTRPLHFIYYSLSMRASLTHPIKAQVSFVGSLIIFMKIFLLSFLIS